MKNTFQLRANKIYFTVLFLFTSLMVFAQDSVTTTTTSTTSASSTTEKMWYMQPTAWIIGGVVLLLIIVLAARGSGNKTDKVIVTKTVTRDTDTIV